HNEGSVSYHEQNNFIAPENIFQKISIAAPYLELVEEMTLNEFFFFHHKMKGWLSSMDSQQIIRLLCLEKSAYKQIRYFSSGMKQRVKLAQAIFSNVPVVLLDEPLTNLDDDGIVLYHSLIDNYCSSRMVIVSSNDKKEYSFCNEVLDIRDYKTAN
ncbi:MAG: ATP-binding cassette domain-containing protein, partial [Ginsengibacter sp.]